MSDRGPRTPPDRSEPEVTLRLLRLQASQTLEMRTLATRYSGCFVHWVKGRSRYCPGAERCENHRIEQVWKGYTPVEVWTQAGNLWIPWVLEITESLDLDFRDCFDRGQVWELKRGPDGLRGKKAPVRGKLLEERPEATFPHPFDMRPVLCAVYHVLEVRLDQQNPMPGRVRLKASFDRGPGEPAQPQKEGPTVKEVLAKRAELLGGLGDLPNDNGHRKSAGS